jgi:hypothetical protein
VKTSGVMIAALVAALGCSNKKSTSAGTPDAAAAAAAPAPAPAEKAPAAPAATAEGGAVSGLKEVTECPKSLGGTEEVARTIKKECGPVRVTSSYYIDGSLTLEAGAVLQFDEGTELAVGYAKPSKIITKGTAADPVILTASGDKVPGFWKGVWIFAKGNRSRLEGVVVEYAGSDRGAILVEATDVAVKGVTVREAKEIGLKLDDRGALTELDGSTFEKAGTYALSLPASALGGLGETNKLEAEAVIQVRGGPVEKSAKWRPLGAPYLFTGDTSIEGKGTRAVVEVMPGTELRFADEAELAVGYSSAGGLVAVGTAEKPILFTSGGEKRAGAWPGVHVYNHGEAKIEHAVFEHGGKVEDRAVVTGSGKAVLSVKSSTFKDNRAALVIDDVVKLQAYEGNKHSGSEKRTLHVSPSQLSAVGAGNTYEGEGERIEVRGGEVKESGTWTPQAVATEVTGDVNVDGRAVLTLSPGVDLRFREGASFSVGYSEQAGLKAVGTAEQPIKLRGVREEAGGWEGVVLYNNARDTVLEHVEVSHTGGKAGVYAHPNATATIKNLTCVKCAVAALTYECNAKLTASDVKAGEATPEAEKKPEGCQ